MAETKANAAEGATEEAKKRPFETLRALALAVLLALGIRSFIVEPFKIPSGSMIPTLLVGDYIIVNKFAYGVREPFGGRLLFGGDTPDRGDVIVFRYPDDPRIDYIKRVIGLPGDKLAMRDGRLWMNGQPMDRVAEGEFSYYDHRTKREIVKRRYREIAANGAEYTVVRELHPRGLVRDREWEVPEGRYFMMGDNRDDSKDSRLWQNPFVSPEQIKGKAVRVHWSWVIGGSSSPERGFLLDFLDTLWRVATFQIEEVRWHRIGRSVSGLAD